MASFYSDDQLSTHSLIAIPEGVSVHWAVDGSGEEVELRFGVNGRVVLDIDTAMIEPIVSALDSAHSAAEQARTAEEH